MRAPVELERAWRRGYASEVTCRAWRPSTSLDRDLDVVDGGVQMTSAPGVRSVLTLDVRATRGTWEDLAPLGTRLRPTVTTVAGRSRWPVGWGTFVVDEQSLVYDGAGVLRITAPDPWSRVITRRLDRPAVPRGNAVEQAFEYIREALGDLLVGVDSVPSPARVGDVVYEDDRSALVAELLEAAGRVAHVGRDGRLKVVRPPALTGAPVWEVDAFDSGVLVSADRSRTAEAVRNRVVVRPAGGAGFAQVTVDDADPRSPTRVDGPMGVRPVFVSNPAIRSAEHARAVARARLRALTALGARINLTTAPHWLLDPGDVISVTLPAQNGDGWGYEHHLVDTVSHPFLGGGGQAVTQSITTVSSRPDGGSDDLTGAL